MFRGGRGRGRFNDASRSRQRGLFLNGVWQCDCTPRLPASHFQVKKAGANHGRWFYTCQKREGQDCKFFLWDEDAKKREEAALLNNSRSEPVPTGEASSNVPGRGQSPPPPYTTLEVQRKNPSPTKRAIQEVEDDDDESFPWPLTGQEEEQLTKAADRAAVPPVTPRKALKSDVDATPGRRRLPWLEENRTTGLLTPSTSRTSRDLAITPSTSAGTRLFSNPVSNGKTSSTEKFDKSVTFATPSTTPTPSRFRDASIGESEDPELVVEVFELLQEHKVDLDNSVGDKLRVLLTKHSLRAQGYAKGREISRLSIKAKDAKITELQHRVTTLEAELETEKAIVQHLKWENETGQASDEL